MDRYVQKFESLLDAALASPPGVWPADHPLEPPAPFFGVRLAQDSEVARGRVAILFPSPLRGGAEDYTLTIARGAAAAGYDVHGAFPQKPALRGLREDYRRAGASCNVLNICDVGPKGGQAPFYRRFTRTIRLLRRLRPKAVLFQLCGMQYGFMSLLACALMRVPVLVVFQLVRDDLRFSPLRRWFYRRMRARGQRYVAVSDANRKLLARAFALPEKEIFLIPNGVQLERYASTPAGRDAARASLRKSLQLPPNAVLCLTVGRLSSQKAHDILIPAIPHIIAQFPDVYFLWAGEGPLEKRLRGQLDVYGIAERVFLLGRRDDIPDLLRASDLFIHPARFEGQPFSLLEAMAAGLPIVSTNASGIAEIIIHGQHGLLCDPDDVAALRDSVIQALAEPDERLRRAGAARVRAQDFSEASMVACTLAALDELADLP